MARHQMTARRRAALRKAQLASARKRKRGGKTSNKIRRTGRAVSREATRKTNYARKHYSGRGGIARKHRDMSRSRGAYTRNWRGKKYGKPGRALNRVSGALLMANPGYAAPVLGSKARVAIHGRRTKARPKTRARR